MARVAAAGWQPVAMPSLNVRMRPLASCPRHIDRILVTSGRALAALSGCVDPSVPVLAVGAATAQRARDLGFQQVEAGGGDAASLLDCLGAPPQSGGTLLFPTGRGLGGELVAGARARGWRIIRRVVYDTRGIRALPPDTARLIAKNRVAAVLFFSAETALAFTRVLSPNLLGNFRFIRAVVLSLKIASTLERSLWFDIAVADGPTQDALLQKLGQSRLAGEAADEPTFQSAPFR